MCDEKELNNPNRWSTDYYCYACDEYLSSADNTCCNEGVIEKTYCTYCNKYEDDCPCDNK